MILREAVPFVLFITIIIGLVIVKEIDLNEMTTIDGFSSIIGTLLGLLILSLNLIYTNNYLITIGPLLVITCLLYLRYRNKILIPNADFNLKYDNKKEKFIKIIYWVCITIGLISYYSTIPYYRSLIFFISTSIGITMIALEILSSKKDKIETTCILIKILIISLMIRDSAYFMSPYPIGSDPWGHGDFINDICRYGSLNVPLTVTSEYYIDYPLMHIYAAISCLIGNISIKNSMSIIGLIIILSTIFVYLIAKTITKDDTISLLATLLINFADFHIRWSIEVIAMTFGIALYTITMYIIISKSIKNEVVRTVLLILLILVISWTHTISSFILLISMASLYIGSLFYKLLYQRNTVNTLNNFKKPFIGCNILILFAVILMFHWMDPRYGFFEAITKGLINALSHEAKFLGRTDQDVGGNLESILNIAGFLTYLGFGIIGSLYCLSKKNANQMKISIVFTQVVLYFIFFSFPLFRLHNLTPDRWPAFIYVFFVIFVGLGLVQFVNIIDKKTRVLSLLVIIFISSFFMITNSSINRDSPIYGEETSEKLIWTESEMALFTKVNDLYDGVIVSDPQTINRPFGTYLKREKTRACSINLNWEFNDKIFIWREATLTSSIYDRNGRQIFLGKDFMGELEGNLNKIYDFGDARAYLGKKLLKN